MADKEEYDPNLVTRIVDRDAKAETYLGTQGPVRNLMARPQLFVANTMDTIYTAADNDKLAIVRGFVGGAMRGFFYGLGAFFVAVLLVGIPAAGAAAGVGTLLGMTPMTIGFLTMAATAVAGSVKAYKQALIMDPLKGAKVGDHIAQAAGALPPPGASLAPAHSAVQDPNIYNNPDNSTKFRDKVQGQQPSQGRGA